MIMIVHFSEHHGNVSIQTLKMLLGTMQIPSEFMLCLLVMY